MNLFCNYNNINNNMTYMIQRIKRVNHNVVLYGGPITCCRLPGTHLLNMQNYNRLLYGNELVEKNI